MQPAMLQEQSYYYTYLTGNASSVSVNIFKKITYKNIYPGIDIEYSFEKGKTGIKYSVIVHPGANASVVKLKYSDVSKASISAGGDIVLKTNVGEITDHAPYAYYEQSKGEVVCSYKLNGFEESFIIGKNNSDEDLIIDPWSTDPKFTVGYDRAYDVDYDNNGNVYAYGSYNPFQLTKFNSAGVQQWTYNPTGIDCLTYGKISVDKVTGTCYAFSGITLGTDAIVKVNSAGVLTGTDTRFPRIFR